MVARAVSGLLGVLVVLRTAWRTLRGREHAAAASVATSAEVSQTPEAAEVDPSQRTVPESRRAETWVAILLLLAAAGGFSFVAFYIVLEYNTQLLGLAMG